MRFAIGAVWHETLGLAAGRTRLSEFHAFQLSEGTNIIARNRGVRNEVGGFLSAADEMRIDISPTLFAGALPAPTVSRDAYQQIRSSLLNRLNAALPVDGVLLALHGAMVADGMEDVEADLLAGVRRVVGSQIPIVAALDLHANLSHATYQVADVLVAYDTFPHTDIFDRGCEAAWILKRLVEGRPAVGRALVKLPLLTAPQAQGTTDEPMREVMARVHELEEDPRVISISVCPGYPYSNGDRLGMAILAYTWQDTTLAKDCARDVAQVAWDRRACFQATSLPPAEAVQRAVKAEGPVILVDAADNIGGGTPGDGTVLLRELLNQGATDAVVTITDPTAVAECIAAGVGNRIKLMAGGKADSHYGEPVHLDGYVRLLFDGIYYHRGSYMTGLRVDMGRTAVLACGGVEVVLNERKAMPFDAEQLRSSGIEPRHKRIIVAKSALAWRSAYGDIARTVIPADTPGLCSSNLARLPYRNRRRPLYPLEEAKWP
jgi:microcystin degradation protein MlrC